MSINNSLDSNFDSDSWIFDTNWEDLLTENNTSGTFSFENTTPDFEFEEGAFALFQMQTSSPPFSKKRSFSEYSTDGDDESRKRIKRDYKIEMLVSDTSDKIDMLGVNLFKPDQYGPCTQIELERYLKAAELEKFEKWINVELPKVRDDCYYTAQVAPFTYNSEKKPITVSVLTGELEEHPIPADASEALRMNLKTAKLIIDFVRSVIPFSSNYLQRSSIFNQKDYDQNCFVELTEFFKKSHLELEAKSLPPKPLEFIVEETLKHKIGNCGYLAALGYFLSRKNDSVDFVNIEDPGDHAFLVFGRNKAFPVSDYKNWGPDAVVCDIWSGAYYPASEIEKYLMDYDGNITRKGIQYTVVEKFDTSRVLGAGCGQDS